MGIPIDNKISLLDLIDAIRDGIPLPKGKTDMVAMLTEIKKEIIELLFPQREPEYMQGYSDCQMNVLDYVIQEKINGLKGEVNDN